MEIRYAHFCAYAGKDELGRLSMAGIADSVKPVEYPALLVSQWLVIAVRGSAIYEHGQKEWLHVSFNNENGGRLYSFSVEVSMPDRRADDPPGTALLLHQLPGMQVSEPGEYVFNLKMGEQIYQLPVVWEPAPETPPA